MHKITCFGEVLWDMLPSGKKLGGAPLNVALRMRSLGNETHIVSSIGQDKHGKELISIIDDLKMPTDYIQHHTTLDTSRVDVQLDTTGSATYTIEMPCAWDDIALTAENKQLVAESDAFIFGSLSSRTQNTRTTLFELLELADFKVFDVNLRPPHYTPELILELANKTDFLKVNDDELEIIVHFCGEKYTSIEEGIKTLAKKTQTKYICVTRGDKGAILYHEGEFYNNDGYKIKVVDTVGAGDSFLASLINKLLSNAEPQQAIDFASAIGAMVAQSEGANPSFTEQEVMDFIASYD